MRNSFSYGSLEAFANLFKEIAIKTDFSNFLIKYKDFYLNLLEEDVKLPQNINLDQLINYLMVDLVQKITKIIYFQLEDFNMMKKINVS